MKSFKWLLAALSLFILPAQQGMAQAVQTVSVPPVETAAKQAFLLDVNTNTPLFAKDADTAMPTSSMSKMLTMYLVFEAVRDGKLSLDSMVPVSEHAWRQEGSRMFLNVGQQAKVEDLIRGVIVQSGNDAAVALAEAVGGSEEGFAEQMNAKAHQLGMNNSHFMNATGMPDPQHYSTARDLATLALALIRDFPERYHYFSELEFTYNGIKQGNRNPLLYRAMQVDGLKTGHTDVGGFGLTASSLRNGRRLVLVLNGMSDMQARADESAKVLDWGYREFGFYPVAKAGDKITTIKTWLGVQSEVDLVAANDLAATLPRGTRANLKASYSYNQPVVAPITKGQVLGSMTLTAPGMEDRKIDLVAANDVAEKGFFARIADKIGLIFGHKV